MTSFHVFLYGIACALTPSAVLVVWLLVTQTVRWRRNG